MFHQCEILQFLHVWSTYLKEKIIFTIRVQSKSPKKKGLINESAELVLWIKGEYECIPHGYKSPQAVSFQFASQQAQTCTAYNSTFVFSNFLSLFPLQLTNNSENAK